MSAKIFLKVKTYFFRPRICQKVTVVVGNPIKMEPILEELRQRGATAEEQRKAITDLIQVHLYKLRVISEVLHARHVSGGWFQRKVADFKLTDSV